MIENLKELELSENYIDKMINTLGYDETLNLSCNIPFIKANINTLKLFGINNIEDLLLFNPDIFLMNPEKLLKKLNNTNTKTFAKLIQEDITLINELLN